MLGLWNPHEKSSGNRKWFKLTVYCILSLISPHRILQQRLLFTFYRAIKSIAYVENLSDQALYTFQGPLVCSASSSLCLCRFPPGRHNPSSGSPNLCSNQLKTKPLFLASCILDGHLSVRHYQVFSTHEHTYHITLSTARRIPFCSLSPTLPILPLSKLTSPSPPQAAVSCPHTDWKGQASRATGHRGGQPVPLTACFQEITREELGFGKNLDQGSGVWNCLSHSWSMILCSLLSLVTWSYPNPKLCDRESSYRSFLRPRPAGTARPKGQTETQGSDYQGGK